MAIHSFRDLEIWRRSLDVVTDIYRLTATFPGDERHGLTSQLRRAAVSVPSNIAEGSRQGTTIALIRYLRQALASSAELETQLEIARRLGYGRERDIHAAKDAIVQIAKMTHALVSSLKRKRQMGHVH